jgi:coenzyme Q-binding protein COQ10
MQAMILLDYAQRVKPGAASSDSRKEWCDAERWRELADSNRRALMPQFSTTRRVNHSAADMFDLVADVERYPQFVPLCRSLKVRKRISEPEGIEVLVADMTIAYKFMHETFASRVTLDRPNLQVLVEYLEGPFSKLENSWTFRPAGSQTCNVEFFIAYEFKSRTLGFVMGTMFDAAFRRFATAFERRADRVYAQRIA